MRIHQVDIQGTRDCIDMRKEAVDLILLLTVLRR